MREFWLIRCLVDRIYGEMAANLDDEALYGFITASGIAHTVDLQESLADFKHHKGLSNSEANRIFELAHPKFIEVYQGRVRPTRDGLMLWRSIRLPFGRKILTGVFIYWAEDVKSAASLLSSGVFGSVVTLIAIFLGKVIYNLIK